jgi:hypothetical protein
MPECWFKGLPDAGPCEGRLVKCHLVKQQVLKREIRSARAEYARTGVTPNHLLIPKSMEAALLAEPWTWVWGCGGPMGPGGHHGQFKPDGPKPIPLSLLPVDFTRRMAELGLWWYVERTFNRRSSFEDTFTSTEDGAGAAAVAAEAYIGRRRP